MQYGRRKAQDALILAAEVTRLPFTHHLLLLLLLLHHEAVGATTTCHMLLS